ncbi:MAG: site-2 protease family protein [Clostridia bacterium]|nr:site-2 protease family protein [Clostridia bacterium]
MGIVRYIQSLFTVDGLISLLLRIPCIIVAISFHECAHAFVADKLGDDTARYMGRLTLNPIKHFDIVGGICMLLLGFGWAKPVPVSMKNFKHPRRDMALVAAAGPVTNFIIAIVFAFLYGGVLRIFLTNGVIIPPADFSLAYMLLQFLITMFTLNLSLTIFNLIPVNPLDGSRILGMLLPDKAYWWLMKYERYIYFGFILLLATGLLSGPLSTAIGWISDRILDLVYLIFF